MSDAPDAAAQSGAAGEGPPPPPLPPAAWQPPPPRPWPPPPQYASPYAYAPPANRGPAPGLAYAGFGYRLLAWLLDLVVQIVFVVAWGAVVGNASLSGSQSLAGAEVALAIIAIVGGLLGVNIFIVGQLGGTLGMRLLGLRIVRESDGSRIGHALAAGRFGVYLVFALFSVIGLVIDGIVIAFDQRRQAIHDKACSTLVVRRL